LEAVKGSQAVLQDVATVQSIFPDTPKLRELCKQISTFQTMKAPEPPHAGSLNDLITWKLEAERNVQTLAHAEYDKPIDEIA
jgi:hypothetical protein